MSISIAIVLVTVVGLLGAIILVLAAKFMSVYEDPRVGEVTECLPGANCGGCPVRRPQGLQLCLPGLGRLCEGL